MRSSGLIYAVIVGAWAAYLVPMWLRRQDELNEARPTERFSTAIRLLSGRAAMQRRYDKERGDYPADDAGDEPAADALADEAAAGPFGDAAPVDEPEAPTRVQPSAPRPSLSERAKRAKVLARRRRTITVLFLTFTTGAIVAAVGGLPFLWAPAMPALLLTSYIIYLRAQERRRFTFTMDQRKAEAAAQRLREGRHRPRQAADQPPADDHPADVHADAPLDAAPEPARAAPPSRPSPTAGRRAVVEETDHAEWVDQQRERERPRPATGSWDPVPVPLPTYVTAPVAPRATSHVDLDAEDAWSSARSSAVPDHPQPDTPARRARGRTPLFDQYEDEDRPRAANE
ncbi:divisome protein SepX/GlpR [Streptomyces lydicus]